VVTQAGGTGTSDQRFVKILYFSYFGRLPSAQEIDFQLVQALQRGTPRENLAENFFRSPEFNIGGRFITGLYVGLLDRDPEYGGWLFQRDAFAKGIVDGTTLVRNFMQSAEYRLKYGNPSIAEFVRLLYRYILLREPSQSEVDFQVANGVGDGSEASRIRLAQSFLGTPEFRNGTQSRLYAFLLHATLLLRDGTASERAAVEAQLNSGTPLVNVIRQFVTSAEFQNLMR
jgi:hypothetical protein